MCSDRPPECIGGRHRVCYTHTRGITFAMIKIGKTNTRLRSNSYSSLCHIRVSAALTNCLISPLIIQSTRPCSVKNDVWRSWSSTTHHYRCELAQDSVLY